MKVCTACGKEKPLTEFFRDRRRINGRMSRCKTCKTACHKAYCKAVGYDTKRYRENPVAERERHLVRKYAVTLADYQRMYDAQNGACAICLERQSRALDVDHDHETGKVRGLLCSNCNRTLGHAQDSPVILRAAAAYLERT